MLRGFKILSVLVLLSVCCKDLKAQNCRPSCRAVQSGGSNSPLKIPLTATPLPSQVLFSLTTTSETIPNASPIISAVGSTAPPCPAGEQVDSGSSNPNCNDPLNVLFDFNASAGVVSVLSDDQGGNLLISTNSLDSTDGSAAVSMTSACNGGLGAVITVQQEDGAVFSFTGSSPSCKFDEEIAGSFTSNGGDSGNFVLAPYTPSYFNGIYSGIFDGSSGPLSTNGAGASTVNLTIQADNSITATAFLPKGSIGACQTQDMNLSTNTTAVQNGPGGGVAGFVSGDALEIVVADNDGNIVWLIGSGTNANGVPLAPGSLFFSGFAANGACVNTEFFDSLFQKKKVTVVGKRRIPKPLPRPRFNPRLQLDSDQPNR